MKIFFLQNVVTLCLSGVSGISFGHLWRYIPNLVDLDVSETTCTNADVDNMVRHCLKLEVLNISNCRKLCHSPMIQFDGNKSSFASLVANGVDVITMNELAILLRKMTHLQHIEHHTIIQVVATNVFSYGIVNWRINHIGIKTQDPTKMVQIRKDIFKIPILFQGLCHLSLELELRYNDISSLCQLHQLETLELNNLARHERPSYDDRDLLRYYHKYISRWVINQSKMGIKPILKANSKTLRRLDLQNVDVDMCDIGEVCPFLCEMSITCPSFNMNKLCVFFGQSLYWIKETVIQWCHLSELVLSCHSSCLLVIPNIVKYLITACTNIQVLYLMGLDNDLHDEFKVFNQSPLRKLETVFFKDLHGLTVDAVTTMLTSPHSLTLMTIKTCRQITQSKVSKQLIKNAAKMHARNAALYF